MMTRTGRPPKPTVLKKLAGNPGKRPLNEVEPKPAGTLPPMDQLLLGDIGQRAWIHLKVELEPLGLATAADAYTLGLLCYHLEMAHEASLEVALNGITLKDRYEKRYRNPADAAQTQHSQAYLRLMGEFGLSPSSRSRLIGLGAPNKDQSLADVLFEGTDAAKNGKSRRSPLTQLVGSKAAKILRRIGFGTVELASTAAKEGYDLEGIPGIGPATIKKLEVFV
jgi:P27 family predicted phage terminase small subunit